MSFDPWERREKERNSRRDTLRKKSDWDFIEWVQENARPLLVILGILCLLGSEIPSLGGTIRGICAISGVLLLIGISAMLRTWQVSLKQALIHPASIATLGLLAWCGVSYFVSPFRAQAGAELLRILGGTTIYFLAAYGLKAGERYIVVGGVVATACLLSIVDFVRMSQLKYLTTMVHRVGNEYSFFGTHENVGSLLALLVPMAAALALSRNLEEKRLWAAQAATLTLTFAWIAARCRSAWMGGGIALVVLFLLIWRSPRAESSRPRNARERIKEALGSPLPVLVGATLVMAIGGGLATFLSNRVATIVNVMDDASFNIRLAMWEGAARMSVKKPLLGWGLGSYPVLEGWWTHLGSSEQDVLKNGATHENIAHNYYVQWAAEAGGIGLALHLIAVLLWLGLMIARLTRPIAPVDRAIALGAIAGIFGACFDAIGSPSYQFHGVYSIFWLLMGLGAASAFPRTDERLGVDRTIPIVLVAAILGIGLASIVPFWGKRLGKQASQLPRGSFLLLSQPTGPELPPGTTVTLRAQYTDAFGKRLNTTPGTTWENPSARETGDLKGGIGQLVPKRGAETQAALRLTLPEKPGYVQIMARFTDREGRRYNADYIFKVKNREKP